MIQKAKNEVFGHILEFGLLDRLDIAYCGSSDNLQGLSSFRKVSDFVSDFIQGLSSSDVEHAVYSVTVLNVS